MNTKKNLLVEAVRNQGCPLMQGKALARIREAGLDEQRTQKSGNAPRKAKNAGHDDVGQPAPPGHHDAEQRPVGGSTLAKTEACVLASFRVVSYHRSGVCALPRVS